MRYPIRIKSLTLLTCRNCWGFALVITGLLFERFSVNCFNLMRGILSSDVYRPMKSPGMTLEHINRQTSKKINNSVICFHQSYWFPELTDTVKMEAYKIKMDFFQFGTLREICHRLVSQYFLLTSEDLSNWDADPEGFCESECSAYVLVHWNIKTLCCEHGWHLYVTYIKIHMAMFLLQV